MFSKQQREGPKFGEDVWVRQRRKKLEIQIKETVLYTWVERYIEMAIRTQKFAAGIQRGQSFGGKLKR